MRIALTFAACLLGAGSAQAGSIDMITSDPTERSIEYIACETCTPLDQKINEEPEAITLAPGTQRIELREINGQMMVFRTEAWLGGSPVTFVSKATGEQALAKTLPSDIPVIDRTTQTSAVSADMNTENSGKSNIFDPAKLNLRTN